jgi:hypothetical protein
LQPQEQKARFCRIANHEDDFTYHDDRIGDNSYFSKVQYSGAGETWGLKAAETLIQVRGKDFRHEKTKKKRGSYKGGFISEDVHSVKFPDSHDDK